MKRAEAEKLLGGYATGTLTGTERRTLFEAALEHQALFDALADEEALRELLADPAARAHVLAALAPAPSKIVPFWRRPGVIGAAAGLLVATTAGLAILRSPEAQLPPAAKPEAAQAPAASAPAAPEAKSIASSVPKVATRSKAAAEVRSAVETPAAGIPAPASASTQVVGGAAPAEAARAGAQAERYQMEARDQLSKKAETAGTNQAAAMMEAVGPAPVPARRMAAKAAPLPAATSYAAVASAPVWTLEALPDGTTRVTVAAPREAHVVLLRRGPSGVEVLKPATASGSEPWQFQLRLVSGDALDLYVLDSPVADPARLPETGPVDGFRARIRPPAKK